MLGIIQMSQGGFQTRPYKHHPWINITRKQ